MSTTQPTFILVAGSPTEGFDFSGPFATPDEVSRYADAIGCPEAWFLGTVHPPENTELGDPDEYEVQFNIPVTVTVRDDRRDPTATSSPYIITSVETNMDALRLSRGNEDIPSEVIEASLPTVTPWPEWTIR